LKKLKKDKKESKSSLRQAIEETLDDFPQPKTIKPGEVVKFYDSKPAKS